MFEEYYHRLNLKPPVTDAEIREAYRQLVKNYHPDSSGTPETREKFMEITTAYRVLKNRRLLWQQQLLSYYIRLKTIEAQEKRQTESHLTDNLTLQKPITTTSPVPSGAERLQNILYISIDYWFLLVCGFMLSIPFIQLVSVDDYYWQPTDFLPTFIGLFFAALCLYFAFWLPRKRRNR